MTERPVERPVKQRLIEAAFALFEQHGYDRTTVDDIAERAGVSRATFFRTFRSKEDVIFPDHDDMLHMVEARLLGSTHQTALVAVTEAVRAWSEKRGQDVNRIRSAVDGIVSSGLTLSKITVAASLLGDLARTT